MVIGNGLISSKFLSYKNNKKIIIFASGVSNSKEVDIKEFEREKKLLNELYITEKKLVYFSTLLVNYPCMENSEYVKHKKNIEDFITTNFKNFIIFRLPNIVGHTKNKFTSFNFFINKIQKEETIYIEKNTTRFFLDSDDLNHMLNPIIDNKTINKKTINICLNNKISISEIIDLISKTLNKKANIIESDSGCDVNIDNSFFLSILKKKNFENYNNNLVLKYCNNGD
jgi:UDP-2-acetamido-2,6-beta-L-arabino-hexul-4-ose reductase